MNFVTIIFHITFIVLEYVYKYNKGIYTNIQRKIGPIPKLLRILHMHIRGLYIISHVNCVTKGNSWTFPRTVVYLVFVAVFVPTYFFSHFTYTTACFIIPLALFGICYNLVEGCFACRICTLKISHNIHTEHAQQRHKHVEEVISGAYVTTLRCQFFYASFELCWVNGIMR